MRGAGAALSMLILMAILASAPVASAEFTSLTKSTSGENGFVQQTLEAGAGVTFSCLAETSPGTWVVKNGSEATEKGPDLDLKAGSTTECTAEKSGGFKVSATSSACEQEFQEPSKEVVVAETILSTCTFKAVVAGIACEVKVEAAGNKELKETTIYSSGEANENIELVYNSSGVTTHVNKACETIGLKATTEAKLIGSSEEKQLIPGLRATFAVGYVGSNNVKYEQRRTATVTNTGAAGDEAKVYFESAVPAFWLIYGMPGCQKKYNLNESCLMEVELVKKTTSGEPARSSWVRVEGPGETQSRVTFFASL